MPSNTPVTQALEPVTQNDRDAAAEWLWDPESVSWDRRDFDKMKSGSWDDHSLIQAFARHRQSSSNASGVDVELIVGLRRQAHSESEASRMMAEAKSKRQTDNPTGECVYMWAKPEETLSWKAAEALSSLSTPTAEPMAELQRLGQEYDGDALREAAQAVVAEAERMTMTMRRRKIFDALARALSATPSAQEGERVILTRVTRAAAERYMLDIPTLEHFGLILDSTTPATTVDESERLRAALREIADDPYQHGQRVQKMKAIARAALSDRPQAEGEVNRG